MDPLIPDVQDFYGKKMITSSADTSSIYSSWVSDLMFSRLNKTTF